MVQSEPVLHGGGHKWAVKQRVMEIRNTCIVEDGVKQHLR